MRTYGYDNPTIDCVGIMRLSRSIPMLKQRLGRGTRPAISVDLYDTSEARRNAIASSVKPSCKVLDLMLQLGEVQNKFADATELITEDADEKRFIREEMRKAGKSLTMDEIDGKLKAKRETDREKQLAKLAEDAANAAERRKNQQESNYGAQTMFIGDILKKYNPAHKPASPGFVKMLQRKGIRMGDGPFSMHQCFLIKERWEKQCEKKQLATI